MDQKVKSFLSKKDTTLAKIIDLVDLPIIESTEDIFFDLSTCIVGQQIHYRGNNAMVNKFLDLLDDQEPTPHNVLLIDENDWIKRKIAGRKYQSLQRLASYWIGHNLDQIDWTKESDEAIRSLLIEISGVGNWSIDMILLYTLKRPDIFPADDYHLKKIMATVYQVDTRPTKSQLSGIADQWQPYRSSAVLYLLAYKQQLKKVKSK